ncbi:MAG: NusG domain II-containing protein [Clostridia bacterium]|nr:NusG domain II-containing protein [Clostridia bacterium]
MSKFTKETAPQKRRRNDILLILGVIAALVLFAAIYFTTQKQGEYAVVLKNGEEIGSYPLSQNLTVPIKDGDKITNTLVIRDGEAYMESALCPDQICVKHKAVSKENETIVCLPSKIVVKITGAGDKGSPDTVV